MTQSRGPTPWVVLVAGVIALEVDALRDQRAEDTLSHATRATFRTHTPLGRALFVTGWTWLFIWFLNHILRGGSK